MLSLDSQNISLPNIAGTKSCAKNWSETIDQTIKGCVYCNTVCPVYQNQLHNLYVILRQHLDWRQDSSIVNARHLNNIFSNINYRLIIIRKSLFSTSWQIFLPNFHSNSLINLYKRELSTYLFCWICSKSKYLSKKYIF